MKTCSKCLVEKKEEAFQLHSNMKDGILIMCRTCKAAAAYARKAAAAITLSAAARYGTSAYATVQSELRGYALGPKK